MTIEKTNTHQEVEQYYANRAEQGSSCCSDKKSFYGDQMILNIPDEVAKFSLGCGNPISLAALQVGETVLDLGSGGGLDCFLAAKEVGSTGKVIGLDMTDEMLNRAEKARQEMGLDQVEFRKGFLEAMPIESDAVDVIISNCVVNLSPDKDAVFAEMQRVLKVGGRIAISDIVTQAGVSTETAALKDSWSACAAGAITVSDWKEKLAELGFVNIEINAKTPAGDLLPGLPTNEMFSGLISAVKN